MRKKIKVKFVDFGEFVPPYDNFFLDSLKKKYDVEISDNPDYLFYGVGGFEHLNYDCVRIFWTIENCVPDFNIADYGLAFEFLDFGDRYLRFPIFLVPPYRKILRKAIERKNDDLKYKTNFCSFVISNGWGDDFRIRLFHKLSKEYKKVDSGGRYLTNVEEIGQGLYSKYEFDLKHKFSFACENSSYPGYTTEKITDAFGAHCIPIYWGDPLIEKEFNSKAFINCNKFDSIDEIIEEIKRIDNDDELYYKMLNEKAFLGDLNKYYNDFDNFLYNIFDQPLEKAYRRDRVMMGRQHEHQYQLVNKLYFKPYKFIINITKFLHIDQFIRKIYHIFRDK